MRTREIPQSEWKAFFDAFARLHENWLVTLDVLGPAIGAQHQTRELPLAGVTSDAPVDRMIHVFLGRPPQHLAHAIRDVTHVWLEQTDEGADAALQIESADGTTTLLQFRSAMLPEIVDGVVQSSTGRR